MPGTPQERAAKIAWKLAKLRPGEGVTTREVADETGMSLTGALVMMYRLSRILPVYQDGRRWVVTVANGLEGGKV